MGLPNGAKMALRSPEAERMSRCGKSWRGGEDCFPNSYVFHGCSVMLEPGTWPDFWGHLPFVTGVPTV